MHVRTDTAFDRLQWLASLATVGGVAGSVLGGGGAVLDGNAIGQGVPVGAVAGGLLGLAWGASFAWNFTALWTQILVAVTVAAATLSVLVAVLVDRHPPRRSALTRSAKELPRVDPKGGGAPPLREGRERLDQVREGLRYVDEFEHAEPALRLCKPAAGDSKQTAIEAKYCRASALVLRGKWRSALRLIEAAIASAGDEVPSKYRVLRADILRHISDGLGDAREEIRRALTADSSDSYLWVYDAFLANIASDYEAALRSANRALQNGPARATAYTEMGTAYRLLGQPELARSSLDEALALGGDDGRALFELGALRSTTGDHAGAEEALKKAIGEYGRRPPAEYLRQLGYEYFVMNQFRNASEVLDHALAIEPKDVLALQYRGDVAEARENFRKALDYYDRGLAIRRGEPALLRHKATALRQLKRPRRALEVLATLVENAPAWQEVAHVDRGMIFLYDLREPEHARREFEEAIRRSPTSAEPHYQRAQALWQSVGKYDLSEIERAFSDAIRLDGAEARYWRDRGYVRYLMGGRAADALADFQAAVARFDKDAWAHYYLAFYGLDEIGADAQATLRELERAIDLQAEPEFFRAKAFVLAYRLRDYAAAYGAIAQSTDLAPRFLASYHLGAQISLVQYRDDLPRARRLAIKYLRRALNHAATQSQRAYVAERRADILFGLNDFSAARDAYDAAIRLLPREATLRLGKAQALTRLRDWTGALHAANAAIVRDDRYADAYIEKAYILLQPATSVCDVDSAKDALATALELNPVSQQALELRTFAETLDPFAQCATTGSGSV